MSVGVIDGVRLIVGVIEGVFVKVTDGVKVLDGEFVSVGVIEPVGVIGVDEGVKLGT